MDKEIKKYIKAGRPNLVVVYILFLCGIVAPLLPIIGAVFSYINKDIKNKYLASHYIFIWRTFWMGFVGIMISMITTIILIGSVLYLCLLVWFILRIAMGFKYLLNGTEHPNYMTYWLK
ncbi:DUF4870 family protein [Candidatus Tisiphia endosymbiont of Hybos culiciformis]|uniref:DUF4870 family protein n=1 Tax=Candidatus Tisiphia endosymbiont of Hybos culiciformis TaxID=3139331 RepID=UPI003CCB581E